MKDSIIDRIIVNEILSNKTAEKLKIGDEIVALFADNDFQKNLIENIGFGGFFVFLFQSLPIFLTESKVLICGLNLNL